MMVLDIFLKNESFQIVKDENAQSWNVHPNAPKITEAEINSPVDLAKPKKSSHSDLQSLDAYFATLWNIF